MKKIRTVDLLEGMKADSHQIILQTNYLSKEDSDTLLQQPDEGKWSIAQIIEHLNSYGRYYLPLIEKSLDTDRHPPAEFYQPGWLGEYFTKTMMPKKNGQVTNKMQSPKNHRPLRQINNHVVIEEFLKQENHLLELLERANQANLERIRIPISLTRFIKLKLGDTFRFLIAHHQRHFVQVHNTLIAVKKVKVETLRFHGV